MKAAHVSQLLAALAVQLKIPSISSIQSNMQQLSCDALCLHAGFINSQGPPLCQVIWHQVSISLVVNPFVVGV